MGNMNDFRKWPQAGRAQLQSILLKSKARYIEILTERARKLEAQLANGSTWLKSQKTAARELEKIRQELLKHST